MKVTCISDLHGYYPDLEGGDLLIVAGDLTARDEVTEYMKFHEWVRQQKYKKTILISGNHDKKLKDGFFYKSIKNNVTDEWLGFEYLCDSGTEFEGLKIWGSPWSLTFPGINPKCTAFTGTEEELAKKWSCIPDGIDILVTHSPPFGLFDEVGFDKKGSRSLDEKVFYMTSLQLHVFGHIHECGGKVNERTENVSDKHISVNASYVNEHYQPVNKPITIIL